MRNCIQDIRLPLVPTIGRGKQLKLSIDGVEFTISDSEVAQFDEGSWRSRLISSGTLFSGDTSRLRVTFPAVGSGPLANYEKVIRLEFIGALAGRPMPAYSVTYCDLEYELGVTTISSGSDGEAEIQRLDHHGRAAVSGALALDFNPSTPPGSVSDDVLFNDQANDIIAALNPYAKRGVQDVTGGRLDQTSDTTIIQPFGPALEVAAVHLSSLQTHVAVDVEETTTGFDPVHDEWVLSMTPTASGEAFSIRRDADAPIDLMDDMDAATIQGWVDAVLGAGQVTVSEEGGLFFLLTIGEYSTHTWSIVDPGNTNVALEQVYTADAGTQAVFTLTPDLDPVSGQILVSNGGPATAVSWSSDAGVLQNDFENASSGVGIGPVTASGALTVASPLVVTFDVPGVASLPTLDFTGLYANMPITVVQDQACTEGTIAQFLFAVMPPFAPLDWRWYPGAGVGISLDLPLNATAGDIETVLGSMSNPPVSVSGGYSTGFTVTRQQAGAQANYAPFILIEEPEIVLVQQGGSGYLIGSGLVGPPPVIGPGDLVRTI